MKNNRKNRKLIYIRLKNALRMEFQRASVEKIKQYKNGTLKLNAFVMPKIIASEIILTITNEKEYSNR